MKAVLISIRPKWCELILSGKKTVEVRKSRPKIATPFKCYIYCTKGAGRNTLNIPISQERLIDHYVETGSMDSLNCPIGNGKVIGEFICDGFDEFEPSRKGVRFKRFRALYESCLSVTEIKTYLQAKTGYGWHISDLVVYDKPKELSEFRIPCRESEKDHPVCGGCKYYYSESNESIGFFEDCSCNGLKHITRPPQSWCYVEELEVAK